MTDKQIIDILSQQEIFKDSNCVNYVIRYIGWGIIQVLKFISNSIEKVVNNIYSLNGFFSSKQIDELIRSLFPIIWGILAISIMFLGFKIMFDRNFKLNNIVKNIIVAISIVMLLPLGMSQLSKMTNASIDGLKSEYKFSADKVIKENLYDIYYLDNVNFKPTKSQRNNIPTNSINYININEVIDSSKVKNKDICTSKITTDKDGKKVKASLEKGIFNLFPENYYRYNFKFWTIILTMGCITFTLVISSIKISRIIFELGFVKVFGILYSFSDISTGQKSKEIIKHIVSNFVILFIISLSLKMYLLFSAWSSQSTKGITQIILLIGASAAVIDGPNIVERILGIDSGVKDGWNTITGINSALNTLSQTGQGIQKFMGSAMNGIASVGSGAVGMYNGFKEGMNPLEEQMSELDNLGDFADKKDDKGNEELKEQTSLHDEMQSQDNNGEFADTSQSSNIEGDNQDINSSNDIDTNIDSNNDINSDGSIEDNKNNNLEMNQQSDKNLSSQIDSNNSSSKNLNTSLENDINKSNPGNYQSAYNNKTGNNISADNGTNKTDNNNVKASNEGHIKANENNKNDNTVGNSSLENEMSNITDSSNNNNTLENEMGSNDINSGMEASQNDMSDNYNSLGSDDANSGMEATQGDMSDYYNSIGNDDINSGMEATQGDMSDYYNSIGNDDINSGVEATQGDMSDNYNSIGNDDINSGVEATQGDMSDNYNSIGNDDINSGVEATQGDMSDNYNS
ncbi:MAG: hypothetical protein RR835_02445, partial [Peptostreptococcaceae bacterium]